jgi:hypothetical protein
MRVDPKELAAAPVSRTVAAEPVRTSVLGAGRPVSARPPAAVISRPVVAVRTPPPPPASIDQRQVQAGGRLNQQALIRPAGPAQPAPNQGVRPVQTTTQPGFRPFSQPNNGQTNSGNGQVHPLQQAQPRTYEQQGSSQPENRNAQGEPPEQNRVQPRNRYFAAASQPNPQRIASAGSAHAAGAGAQPGTGAAAGAEVQSMAPGAACDSSACAAAGPSPQGSGAAESGEAKEVKK